MKSANWWMPCENSLGERGSSQPLSSTLVKTHMVEISKSVLPLIGSLVIVGCATGEPVNREANLDDEGIARAIGCTSDQVAVCVAVYCELVDYVCAEKGEMRRLFEPRIPR